MNAKTPVRAPQYIAHWVIKTPRRDELVEWYKAVFGAEIVHSDKMITFLSWDGESHRLALVNLPRVLRFVFPLSRIRRKLFGIDHIAILRTVLIPWKRCCAVTHISNSKASRRSGASITARPPPSITK